MKMTNVNVTMQKKSNEPKTYRIGMWIVCGYDLLLLSQVAPLEVAVISPQSGNRFNEAISVGDPNQITEDEMRQILCLDDETDIEEAIVVVRELNIEVS